MLDKLSGSRLLRTVVLSPWLMSNVVVGLLFLWILDFRLGVANAFLEWIGIGGKPFFTSDTWAIPTIAGINVWRHMGYTALLLFAGLQTIPKSVKEAAFVDGCGEARRFFHVILPLMRPVLAVVIVITVIGSFQIFDTVDVTTGGGPVNATRVIYVYIFDQAFGRRNFGYASAMAVILFLILALVTFIQMRVLAGQRVGPGVGANDVNCNRPRPDRAGDRRGRQPRPRATAPPGEQHRARRRWSRSS